MASAEQLPTRGRMFQAAAGEVKGAIGNLDAAAAWVRSDWTPVGASLTDTQAEARAQFDQLLGEVHTRLEQMRQLLDGAAHDDTEQ